MKIYINKNMERDQKRIKKNAQIRESFIKTKMKRESQVCKVFQVKIQEDSLKLEQ